jgi:hypothetical protein
MQIRVKGATLINTMAVVRELVSPQRYQFLINQCPVETQHLLKRTLVAVELIPVDSWSPFMDAIFEHIAGRDENQYRRIMRVVCKRDFDGVYRSHINGVSARALIAKGPQIWNVYFDSGTLTTREIASHDGVTQAQAEVRDFETRSMIFAPTIHAYIEQLLIMTGAQKLLVTRVRDSRRDGVMSCDYLMTFSGGSDMP